MRKMFLLMSVAGFCFAGSAHADQAGWCAAYARDFADARATDKTMWQHKYDIAQKACLDDQKQTDAAPPLKKVETVATVAAAATPPKPAAPAAAVKAVTAPPAPAVEKIVAEAKPMSGKGSEKKLVEANLQEAKAVEKKVADNTKQSAGPPQPGSAAWNAYCANKYTSYDAKSGMYRSLTGVQRKCRYTG